MQIKDLKFPQPVLDVLKKEITELNPPQADAVKKGLLDGKNLVVASPTASGKTLIAELAIIKKFLANEKSVYLVPLKALASEKYDDFTKKYKSIGMRVALSTGDYDGNDDWLGGYDVIILSNEKMDSLLRHNSKWIADIKLIVADEIHLIDDASRGPTLEIVLTKLRMITNSQILALSATISNANEIAKWLNAQMVQSDYRPVKLHKGVYYPEEDEFVIEFLEKDKETLPATGEGGIPLCIDTLKKNKQALVFTSARRSAEAEAEKISVHVQKFLSADEKLLLKKLSEDVENALSPPTRQCKRLSRILANGVAFHHAGLVAVQRKIIEDNFRSGLIKFIASTPTLAFGINMPAYRVLIRDLKRFDSEYGSYYIPNFEVQQMLGRAGRPKYDEEGEAIIISKSSRDAEDLKERYLLSELEPIYSKLSSEPVLRMHVLALIASETAGTRSKLEKFFGQTFFAHQYGNIDEVMERVEKIIEQLRSFEFITAFSLTNDIKLKATRIGKRVAELYVDPLSAKLIIDNIGIKNDLGYLTIINKCAEMRPRLRVKKYDDIDVVDSINIKIPDVWDVEYEDFLSAYYTALMFRDWMSESTEDKLLEKYSIAPGELYNKITNAEWMIYAGKELAVLLNSTDAANHLNKLRLRIKYGVRQELLELVALRGIGRVRARLLWESGLRTINAIKSTEKIKLEKILGAKLAEQVLQQINEDRYEKFARIKSRN